MHNSSSFTSYRHQYFGLQTPLVQTQSPYSDNHAFLGGLPQDPPNPSRRKRRWAWHIFSHLASFLWLAPMTALLVLNYKRHIIGASVWCPAGRCSADAFGLDATQRASKLDRNDHNALGGLQFVAKALEIWFMIIATTLVYDFAMLFARRGSGLPVGFFLTHLEFGDVRNLFNPLMWTAPLSHNRLGTRQGFTTVKLYLFAILAAFLTILANLMGPATAVLVLPTLQWVDTPRIPIQIFSDTGLDTYPQGEGALSGCTAAQLDQGNYTCTYDVYGSSLDKWADSAISARKQAEWHYGKILVGSSQEGILDFTLNFTKNGELFWVPNRKVLLLLSLDTYSLDIYETKIYNNSLQTLLQRQGPSLGMQAACYVGNMSYENVTHDKGLRCYTGWTLDLVETFTKCVRVGTGWNAANVEEWFQLSDAETNRTATKVLSLFSDKAILFNAERDFGSGIASCLEDLTRADCNWEEIFDTELPQDFRNTTVNLGIIEYQDLSRPDDTVLWCESVAYLGFPTYTFDTSSSNIRGLVGLNNVTDMASLGEPQVVSPFWLLAAWSAPPKGTIDDHRPMAREINRMLPTLIGPWDYQNLTYDQTEFLFLHAYALSQSLSMVNYYYDDATAPDGSVIPGAEHPLLSRYATLRVWAYGINSRTSRLGVAVVLAGCGCVLLRLILGFIMQAHNQSSVEMFVAALEYQPKEEFNGLVKEHEWAKVRYSLNTSVHGKPTFLPRRG
jgi:hypothetical protein